MTESTAPARTRTPRILATRGRRVTAAVAGLALAGAGAAAALFIDRAEIEGGGSAATFDAAWVPGIKATTLAGSVTSTPPTMPANFGDPITLPTSSLQFFPGDRYTFTASVGVLAGSAPGYVNGLTMPGLPAGYTATLTSGCAASVAAATGSTPAKTATVTVEIRLADDATADGAWTLAGAGVTAAPASQVDAAGGPTTIKCAPFVGGTAPAA